MKQLCVWAIVSSLCVGCAASPSITDGSTELVEKEHGAVVHEHRFCGWLHEFLDDPLYTELGYDTFAAHADDFDAVHPKWWRVASPIRFENHPPDRKAPYAGFHDARVLSNTTPGGKRTRLIPLIAAIDRPDVLAVHRMIHDPTMRRRHVAGVVDIVMSNGYDGIEIDYEHMDQVLDPKQSILDERAAFSAFMEELGTALHARGKELSLAVSVGGGGVFDYETLSRVADQVHVMAYDFHWEGGPHAGPVAPLGWIQESIEYIGTLGDDRRSKFIFGLANYGIWGHESPDGLFVGSCDPVEKCLGLFEGPYETTTDHMNHCSLAGKRYYAPGRTPNRILPDGNHLFFEDLGSLEEKVIAAEQGRLGGITYWSIGGEPGGDEFFKMVKRHLAKPGVRVQVSERPPSTVKIWPEM